MEDEIEIKWWSNWLEAEHLKRLEMVEQLPFINRIKDMTNLNINENILKETLALMLNGLFEDLENTISIKQQSEKIED